MKEVKNGNGYSTYTSKGSRWQLIKHNAKGDPYVTRKGQRFPLDLFEARADGKCYHFLTYDSCITLEINPNGDMALVKYSYTARSSDFWTKSA
jgi:hypothetical protein